MADAADAAGHDPARQRPRRPRQRPANGLRYRCAVVSRLLAALAGGYALANASAILLARLLPLGGMARAEAVLTAAMLSFLVCAGAVLWAFAARSAARAWWGVLSAALVCGVAAWLAGPAR